MLQTLGEVSRDEVEGREAPYRSEILGLERIVVHDDETCSAGSLDVWEVLDEGLDLD